MKTLLEKLMGNAVYFPQDDGIEDTGGNDGDDGDDGDDDGDDDETLDDQGSDDNEDWKTKCQELTSELETVTAELTALKSKPPSELKPDEKRELNELLADLKEIKTELAEMKTLVKKTQKTQKNKSPKTPTNTPPNNQSGAGQDAQKAAEQNNKPIQARKKPAFL